MGEIHIINDTDAVIEISDLSITIAAGETIDMSDYGSALEIAESNDILPYIASGQLIVNDGLKDLDSATALRTITGHTIAGVTDRNSGKLRVHQTSRQPGTRIYFTGSADDPLDPHSIGSGEKFIFHHKVGDPLTSTIYYDFNNYKNTTFIHEAYLIWKNANFDSVTVDFVTTTPQYNTNGTNTNMQIYGNVIAPAAGNGNVILESDVLECHGGMFQCLPDERGITPPGFWNVDCDEENGKFANLTPAPFGDGQFNIFAGETILSRIANDVPVLGNGFQKLQSSDIDILPHGIRLKATFDTYTNGDGFEDHDWSIAFMLVLHRTFSIGPNQL